MAPGGNGRFDDSRLDELVAAIDDAEQRVAYFDAMFRELVDGAREATDEAERERYATQALAVSSTLIGCRNALAISELSQALRRHDVWAHDEALAGNACRQQEDSDP